MAESYNFQPMDAQLKPLLTERRTVDVSRRKFAQWQLTRPLTETTISPRQSPSRSV